MFFHKRESAVDQGVFIEKANMLGEKLGIDFNLKKDGICFGLTSYYIKYFMDNDEESFFDLMKLVSQLSEQYITRLSEQYKSRAADTSKYKKKIWITSEKMQISLDTLISILKDISRLQEEDKQKYPPKTSAYWLHSELINPQFGISLKELYKKLNDEKNDVTCNILDGRHIFSICKRKDIFYVYDSSIDNDRQITCNTIDEVSKYIGNTWFFRSNSTLRVDLFSKQPSVEIISNLIPAIEEHLKHVNKEDEFTKIIMKDMHEFKNGYISKSGILFSVLCWLNSSFNYNEWGDEIEKLKTILPNEMLNDDFLTALYKTIIEIKHNYDEFFKNVLNRTNVVSKGNPGDGIEFYKNPNIGQEYIQKHYFDTLVGLLDLGNTTLFMFVLNQFVKQNNQILSPLIEMDNESYLTNHFRYTLLGTAAGQGNIVIMDRLLKHEKQLLFMTYSDFCNTPLELAAHKNKANVLLKYIDLLSGERWLNPGNERSSNGLIRYKSIFDLRSSVIKILLEKKYIDTLQLLIDRGLPLNSEQNDIFKNINIENSHPSKELSRPGIKK